MQGLLIAAGKHIKSGTIKDARVIDLAPTILTLLEQPIPPGTEGRSVLWAKSRGTKRGRNG